MRPEYVYCGEICLLTASQNDENGKVETIYLKYASVREMHVQYFTLFTHKIVI